MNLTEARLTQERILFHKPTPLNGKDFYLKNTFFNPDTVNSPSEKTGKQTEWDEFRACSSEESAGNPGKTVSTKATIHCEYASEILPSTYDFPLRKIPDESRSLNCEIDKHNIEDENISRKDAARDENEVHPDSSSSVEENGVEGAGNRMVE